MVGLNGKTALVTGGAGFIGSNLCERLLKEGNAVICLDNLSTGKLENIAKMTFHPNFKFVKGDIRDFTTCKQVTEETDIIFHQAALGSVPRSIATPLLTHAVNNTGFLNVLEAARLNNVERFIYAASSSTYGDSKALPKKEEQIGNPLSPYAVTKLTNELYAQVYANLYGIKVIGLRYFNVFGRRQDPNGAYAAAIPKFIKLLFDHESPEIHGDGTQSRDFTYIDNVIEINLLAAITQNNEAFNQVYNVAYGAQTTLNELFEVIKEVLLPFDSSIRNLTPKYGAERQGDVKHSHADISKAKRLLSYSPQFDLKSGMDETVKWYVEALT